MLAPPGPIEISRLTGPPADEHDTSAVSERSRLLRAEQVKLLYSKAPMALAAILVNAPILVFILWGEVRHAILTGWLMYTVILSLGRVWLMHEYGRRPPSPLEDSRWGTWYLAGIALSGIGWGSVGAFLFPIASLHHQLFIAFVLAGMAAGSVAACSAMMVGVLLFALPALIPLTIQFLAQGDDLHLAMGGMIALYTILMVFLARTMHQTIITSLNLRFENQDLIRYLATSKSRIELLNKELTVDIAERKRVEETIRESAKRIRAIFEQAPLGIAVIDSHTGQFIEINRKYCEIAGFSEEEMRCRTFQDITHPEDLQADLGNMKLLLEGTIESFEMDKRYVRKDDSTVWVHLTVVPLWWGAEPPRHHIAMVEDITERKQAEERLARSRDFYLSILEEFPALIWRSGMDAKCDYFNKTWLSFTGRTLEQELGDGWAEGVHPDDVDRCVASYLKAFHAREPFILEYRLRRYDGEYRDIIDYGSPFNDLEGNFAGFIGSCYDISERKRAEEEREKLILQLKDVMAKIKVLQGMLPICAYCKKIRDEQGSWHSVETYVREHSDVDFTHGICPDCLNRLSTDSG